MSGRATIALMALIGVILIIFAFMLYENGRLEGLCEGAGWERRADYQWLWERPIRCESVVSGVI